MVLPDIHIIGKNREIRVDKIQKNRINLPIRIYPDGYIAG